MIYILIQAIIIIEVRDYKELLDNPAVITVHNQPMRCNMAKAENKTETKDQSTEEGTTTNKQGVAVVLPDGTKRIDFIKKRYYVDGAERGAIAKELSEKLGRTVPYQIVFAGTKEETVTIDGKEYTRQRPSKVKAQQAEAEAGSETKS